MHCRRPLVLLLALAVLLVGGCKKEFKSFPIPNTRATVSLPNPVRSTEQAVLWTARPNDEAVPRVAVYFYEGSSGTWMVSAYPLHASAEQAPEDRLREAANAIRERFKVSEKDWVEQMLPDHGNVPAMDISYPLKKQNQQARTRLFLAPGHLYNLTAVGNEDWVLSEDTDTFLNSFGLKRPLDTGGGK